VNPADAASTVDPPTETIERFDPAFRARLRELLIWRRDVRCFRREPLPEGTIERLIALACLAPSVGLSQPWRFVRVDDAARRHAVREMFAACNAAALANYASTPRRQYAALKLAGLDDAPIQLAVFADRMTAQGHGLGRRTMPETVEYSAVVAIHTLWLAARAEEIGVGWVSILEPERLAAILDVPEAWRLVAYLCIGYPEREDRVPALERAGWEQRREPASVILQR
jgi:5,6-dimethylbenzimidazole synthase